LSSGWCIEGEGGREERVGEERVGEERERVR
jgi:hypothetical protein